MQASRLPGRTVRKLTATLVMGGKGLMKLEGEQLEKEAGSAGGVACGAAKGKKGKAKTKEPTKQKAHTPFSFSEFCLPLIGV